MTTALEPEKALEFVSTFVGYPGAAEAIGTEIMIFESLATNFAESCLREFLGNCTALGMAVHKARLALLRDRNPLGLLYIPFALPGLQMTVLGQAQSVPPKAMSAATSGPQP